MTHFGIHHYHHKKRSESFSKLPPKTSIQKLFDAGVYLSGLFSIAILWPQMSNIWVHHAVSGISVITWIGFLISSLFWMIYGVVNKVHSIIVLNLILTFVNAGIVVGIILYS
ncbi:hypothetical protein HGA88_00635 [Candidatus Roizmanbacteria bacterium]|nr:hypothetical protein [Candidatus Roizmanbacteria bacterium]